MSLTLDRQAVETTIFSAFPANAWSIEYRDQYNVLSVRFFDDQGNTLFTVGDKFERDLRNKSQLLSRIEQWKTRLSAQSTKVNASGSGSTAV